MNSTDEKKEPKPITIIVNGRPKEWNEKTISFKQVVVLAFSKYEDNDQIVYTVTYLIKKGEEGTMVAGDEVKVRQGMVFNVSRTDKS